MTRHPIALLVTALLVVCGCEPAAAPPAAKSSTPQAPPAPPSPPGTPAAAAPASESQAALVAAYRAAHAKKDVEAMLKLYWMSGASDDMQQTIRENVEAELRSPITSVTIDPAPPGKYGPTVEGGIHWRPSLDVVAVVTVNFDTSHAAPGELAAKQVRLTVGTKGNASYFTVPIRQ